MNKPDIDFIKNLEIPQGSYLGLNYSHMHDTSIAIVSPTHEILFASSYERLSRVKMDGRFPTDLLQILPMENFSSVSLPYYESTPENILPDSKYHNQKRSTALPNIDQYPKEYFDILKNIDLPKRWSGHQNSHAALAYFLSGFEKALVLTYDGGAYNCPWFGGVYLANEKQLKTLDLFSSKKYAKITTLYTFITAALGFTPVKHEGKITGLAALGQKNPECIALLKKWFVDSFEQIENCFLWRNLFHLEKSPTLWVRKHQLQPFIEALKPYSKEDIAFAVQYITENHILEIVTKIKSDYPDLPICLGGGLFANVKLNQKIQELINKPIFVAPPMGDDGLSLGAILFQNWASVDKKNINKRQMYLGTQYSTDEVKNTLDHLGCVYTKSENPKTIAELLNNNKVVAIFTGAMEFGPRALCNRTILANPKDSEINHSLNKKLHRTEFMPFAPVLTTHNIQTNFENTQTAEPCLPFMTITLNCKESFAKLAPAVVHVDNTARPQAITKGHIAENILEEFQKLSGIPALINTSFNVHEEPIVCNPIDAIKGFLKAEIDFLYIEGFLLEYHQNKFLLDTLTLTPIEHPDMNTLLHDYIGEIENSLSEKESQIQLLLTEIDKIRQAQQEQLNENKEQREQNQRLENDITELLKYKAHIENHPLFKLYKKFT